uniref:Uridine 5'-monophosphate synthase n=2 Tax=Ascaris TaxID=6251 RepID=A0A9J2Q253_ASCLU
MDNLVDTNIEAVLLDELDKHDVFKLGEFILKSGIKSPIYVDLRVLISAPNVLRLAADGICRQIRTKNINYDYIVGVPYGALPIATLVCDRLNASMLLLRKEAKKYGMKKLIEGEYKAGGKVLVIEDVVTSGSSILETYTTLHQAGLVCENVICVLDREQGGKAKIKTEGMELWSVLTMAKILDYLVTKGRISVTQKFDILDQLAASNLNGNVAAKAKEWSIAARYANAKNPLTKRLLDIMNKKKTCLCVAIDYTKCEEVLKVIEVASDYVCAIKLHADILEDFSKDFVQKLIAAANSGDFIVFEDRKLADTGNTVELQLKKGLYGISSWAHIITVHALPGQPILTALRKVIQQHGTKLNGCLLVAELSTEGALTNSNEYLQGVIELAKANRDVVSGFICQKRCTNDPSFLYWTPGVNLDAASDGAGQQWRSVDKAISEQGNDIVIVGRAITDAADIHTQMRRYRDASWEAHINATHRKE